MKKTSKMFLVTILICLSMFVSVHAEDGTNEGKEANSNLDYIYTIKYDEDSRLLSVKNRKQDTYKYSFDELERLECETDFLGNKQSYSYTPEGKIDSITDFNGQLIDYIYENGNVDKIIYQNGEFKDFDYDPQGRLVRAANRESELEFKYNNLDQLIQVKDVYKNKLIDFEYDSEGNRTKTSWDNGNKSMEYIYNSMNQLSKLITPDGTSSFTYNNDGQELTRQLPNGTIIERAYYPDGKTKSIVTKNSTNKIIASIGYIYNQDGNLIFEIDDHGKFIQYKYDRNGRVSDIEYPFGQGKEIIDFRNRLKAGLFPEMDSDNYGPDIYNDLAAVNIDLSGLSDLIDFDLNVFEEKLQKALCDNKEVYSRYTGENHKNGIWNITSKGKALPFIQKAKLNKKSQRALKRLFKQIAPQGRRLDLHQHMWQESFSYDLNNNISCVQNGWGQIQYVYNKANQLVKSGNRIFTYDNNGNLLTENLGSLKATYKYTADNRLEESVCSVAGFLGDGAGLNEYIYDAFGRRTKQAQYDADGYSMVQENDYTYNYSGGFELLEERVSGLINDIFSYSHANGNMIGRTGMADPAYYSHDRLGSVRLLIDSFGEKTESYRYSAFGQAYSMNSQQSFGYNGKSLDKNTGTYNYGYRDYRPDLGRFTTIDPIYDGENWYAYVYNDPINYIDPDGLEGTKVENTTTQKPEPLTGKAKKLMKKIKEVIKRDEFLPDAPLANGQPATHCNEAGNAIATELGYNTKPLLEKSGMDKTGPKSIGWTNANDMTANAEKAAQDPKSGVKKVTEEQAQELANQGEVVIAAQSNPGGSGHIGVVAPSNQKYDAKKGPLIGQAGAENGIRPAIKSFNKKPGVIYVKLPKE